MTGKDIICIIMAYLLGGMCTGYYLVRLKLKQDIRDHGSGGVGARNVGRLLGKPGFVLTMLGDALKGGIAILLARKFDIAAPAVSLVLVAVIAGHIWPLPLQFRGGRGIATAIGSYLIYDFNLALILLGLTVVLMAFRRGFILSGLAAFLLLPLVAYALKLPGHEVAALAGASAIILFAHRERLRKVFAEIYPQKEA
ncbi:glycerol-3-phosphate acyltransferase [Pontiellaceae bacterium B12227]|nr:glycerol-3-phosphate acyltransferase [Pontiellaceae bacterium B12227]